MSSVRLKNSFDKYGVEKHTFEIIEECEVDMLNERERYWQEYYNVLDQKKGLNCVLTSTKDKIREETDITRFNRSISHIGKKHTEETRKRMSIVQTGLKKKKYAFDGSRIRVNIKNQVFNLLKATENFMYKSKILYWEFECKCGVKKYIQKHLVTTGKIKSCGCLVNKRLIPKIGDKYNFLTITKFVGFNEVLYKDNRIHYIPIVDCICDCGKECFNKNFNNIKKSHVRSCGCLKKRKRCLKNSTIVLFAIQNGQL